MEAEHVWHCNTKQAYLFYQMAQKQCTVQYLAAGCQKVTAEWFCSINVVRYTVSCYNPKVVGSSVASGHHFWPKSFLLLLNIKLTVNECAYNLC